MAEIATYKCSNNQCAFVVRISSGIAGRYERLCHACRRVDALPAGGCSSCGSLQVHYEQLGRECPRCMQGTFLMPRLSVL